MPEKTIILFLPVGYSLVLASLLSVSQLMVFKTWEWYTRRQALFVN